MGSTGIRLKISRCNRENQLMQFTGQEAARKISNLNAWEAGKNGAVYISF
jgi:hypothetical protein